MYPRLVTTPYFTLHTFGVLLALAYLLAIWWVVRAAGRERLKVDRITSLCFWAVLGGLVGAKLLLLIREWPLYAQEPGQLLSRSFLESAGEFYGGFLGALAASMLYFLTHPELPFWKMADLFGPAIALGQAVGRIGCLVAGDDYGTPTKLPWGVGFTHPDAALIGGAPLGIPLHPIQLYESLFCLALFFSW